jgi:hypothetical protein
VVGKTLFDALSGVGVTDYSGHIADTFGLLQETQMPWQECRKMDERLRFIARLLDGERMAGVRSGHIGNVLYRRNKVLPLIRKDKALAASPEPDLD